MRGFNWRAAFAAAIAGASLMAATTGAQAHDDEWRWKKHKHHGHWREYDPPRRVIVERQTVVRQAPVYVAPAPNFLAPMAQGYGYPLQSYGYAQPVDPPVNLNFTIPLR